MIAIEYIYIDANGNVSSYIIFKGENMSINWISIENINKWRFASNSKEWTSNELDGDWLKTNFWISDMGENKERNMNSNL